MTVYAGHSAHSLRGPSSGSADAVLILRGTWSAAPLLANAICLQTGDSAVHQATTLLHSQSHSFNHLSWLEMPKSWGDCSGAHHPSAHSSLQSLRGSGGPVAASPSLVPSPSLLPSGTQPCYREPTQCQACALKHLGPRPHSTVGMSRPLSFSLSAPALPHPEKLLLNDETPGFLASRGDKFTPGSETRMNHSELLCNKVLLKYQGDKASDIGIRRGQKKYPQASLQLDVIVTSSLLIKRKECLKTQNGTR